MKYIVLTCTVLDDGIGDWIHILEISQFIRKQLDHLPDGDNYKIAAFVYNDPKARIADYHETNKITELFDVFYSYDLSLESMIDEEVERKVGLELDDFATKFPAKYKTFTAEDLNNFKYYHIVKALQEKFIRDNRGNIIGSFQISTDRSPKVTEPSILTISMLEHGLLKDGSDISLDMGIGYFEFEGVRGRSEGIRVDPTFVATQRISHSKYRQRQTAFFKRLSGEHPEFTQQLLASDEVDIETVDNYFKSRRFIPADLRTKNTLLAFIKLYYQLFGADVDFYLPKKFVADEEFQTDLRSILSNYKLISPACTDEPVEKDACVRIFYGYPFSDDDYKKLYLFNDRAGAGSAGDDTFCTALCSGNLPFHAGNSNQWGFIKNCLIPLLKQMELGLLKDYFEMINIVSLDMSLEENTDAVKKLMSLVINPDLMEELKIFRDFVFEYYNIYPTLNSVLQIAIDEHNNTTPKQDIIAKIKTWLSKQDSQRQQALELLLFQRLPREQLLLAYQLATGQISFEDLAPSAAQEEKSLGVNHHFNG